MKYLKTYSVFENKIEDLVSDIDDICLELIDIGYQVNKSISIDGRKWYSIMPGEEQLRTSIPINLDNLTSDDFYKLDIHIFKPVNHKRTEFKANDIKEYVLRLADYIKNGYVCTIYLGNKIPLTIEDFVDICNEEVISADNWLKYLTINIYKSENVFI